MDLKQQQKLSQRLVLSPQMKQSLHLLQLPLLELKSYLEQQIEENPVLEHKTSEKHIEESLSEEKIKEILALNEKPVEDLHYNSPDNGIDELQKRQRYKENAITKGLSLHDHLMRQLCMHKLDRRTAVIGEYIIADIDDNGYLHSSVEEIMTRMKNNPSLNEKKITKNEFEDALAFIQTFEPTGIAARSLKECLLLQLKARNKSSSLAYTIVDRHLADIAKKKIPYIAKKLKKPHWKLRRRCRK